jgi:hypothetical protein
MIHVDVEVCDGLALDDRRGGVVGEGDDIE